MIIKDNKINLIKLDLSKREGCNHPDICKEKQYVVKYWGNYIIGKFYPVWYGWSFDCIYSILAGIQLDCLQEVWEIVDD